MWPCRQITGGLAQFSTVPRMIHTQAQQKDPHLIITRKGYGYSFFSALGTAVTKLFPILSETGRTQTTSELPLTITS